MYFFSLRMVTGRSLVVAKDVSALQGEWQDFDFNFVGCMVAYVHKSGVRVGGWMVVCSRSMSHFGV